MPLAPLGNFYERQSTSQAPLLLLYLLLRTPRSDGSLMTGKKSGKSKPPAAPAPGTRSHNMAHGRFPILPVSHWSRLKERVFMLSGQPDSLNNSWGLLFWQLLDVRNRAGKRRRAVALSPCTKDSLRLRFPGSRRTSTPSRNALLGDLMSGRGWDASRNRSHPKLPLCQENSVCRSLHAVLPASRINL